MLNEYMCRPCVPLNFDGTLQYGTPVCMLKWDVLASVGNPTPIDYLTCGSCLKEFPLQKITSFIQHKKLDCEDGAEGPDEDPELQCHYCPRGFMTAWGLLIHAQLTHNLKIFLEKASKSFFEQSKLSSLSPATKLSDSKLSISANAPWQPDKNLTEPYTRAMHPTVSDLVSACVSNAVFGTSIGPETNKKMLIAADTDAESQYVVRNDTDHMDTGLTQTDRQTKDNLSMNVGQQIIAVPCKQVTTTPSLVVQKSLPELSESCNELLGTLRTRSQTQPSIPCLISDLAGDSSQNVIPSPAFKVENSDILKTDGKAMKMQETDRPFPQNILKTSGEKDALGVNAGEEGKIGHGKTTAFKLPECKIKGSVTDKDKLESVDSDKLLDLSIARNERFSEVSSVIPSVLAVQDKQVDKETGSVTDSEKQCGIGNDDSDKFFKSNKAKTLALKEGASASATVLAVQENKADMETESASDIKERSKTGIVESDRLFDLSKARTVALTEGTSVGATVLALPKNQSDIETGRVGEVERTGRESENKDDTETDSVGVVEKIGEQGIQEVNNCDADDDMGNEKIEPCCDTQGCGITIIPGSHQRLQKCCNAVVPKKRKRHFETKHMPFSWSSSKYAKRRMLQGSRERQYSGSKSSGSSTIYIDVEPAHYGPETTSTSSSTESTLHVTQTQAAGERVLTSQGKPRSLILKPGAVFSIPFTYSIPVSKSSKLLVPARLPQQPLAASSLDSSGSHEGQTGSKSSNTVDQEMVQSITNDVTNVTEEIDVIPILEETRRRKYPTSKPFKCEVCSLAFNQRIHLKKHMSKHTGIKPFKCGQCDYSTVERSHLKVHIRIHTGEKPFKCTYCEYATAQNSTLKIHLKRHHGGQMFQCQNCDKKFTQQTQLNDHKSEHSPPSSTARQQTNRFISLRTMTETEAADDHHYQPETQRSDSSLVMPSGQQDESANGSSEMGHVISLPSASMSDNEAAELLNSLTAKLLQEAEQSSRGGLGAH